MTRRHFEYISDRELTVVQIVRYLKKRGFCFAEIAHFGDCTLTSVSRWYYGLGRPSRYSEMYVREQFAKKWHIIKQMKTPDDMKEFHEREKNRKIFYRRQKKIDMLEERKPYVRKKTSRTEIVKTFGEEE